MKMHILENRMKKFKRSLFQNGMYVNVNVCVKQHVLRPVDQKISVQKNKMKMRIFRQKNMPFYTKESTSDVIQI